MAPKKKQQRQKSSSSSSKGKSQSSSSSSTGPKLQITAENESRLRRLLINSGRSAPSPPVPNPAEDTLSRAQKAKKLRSLYEKLSCEGFSDDQIERALSALKVYSICLNFHTLFDFREKIGKETRRNNLIYVRLYIIFIS